MILCNDCSTIIIPDKEIRYCRCCKTNGYRIDGTIYYHSYAKLVSVFAKNDTEEIKIQVFSPKEK